MMDAQNQQDEETSWVYVMGADTGDRKIGVSDNPHQRLAILRPTAPDGCQVIHATKVSKDCVFVVEKLAHNILRLNRTHGEWFDVTTDAAIEAVVNAVNVLNIPAHHVKGEDLYEQQETRERSKVYLLNTAPVPRIPRDIYEGIRAAAAEDRRTIAAEITLALEAWLDARDAGTKRK